jgi:hemolysin III
VIPAEYLVEHYPNRIERAADACVHGFGLLAFSAAGGALVYLASLSGRVGLILASAIFGLALIAMLSFSAAYNFSRVGPARPFLRRLDEAGIFLLIAASYTPFTSQRLESDWATWTTAAVWAVAGVGILSKLLFARIPERVWTTVYALFGWMGVIVLEPLSRSLPVMSLLLLIAGGLVYTAGCAVFLNARAPFRRAVWHIAVCLGAALHCAAVFTGVLPLGG